MADIPSIWRLNGIHGRSDFAPNGKSAEMQWYWHENFPLKSNSYDQLWKYKKDVVYLVLKEMASLNGTIPIAVREEMVLTQAENTKRKKKP